MPPVIKTSDQDILVATSEYPYAKWKFEKFNPVQSRIMDFYNKDNNGLIAAMTSAGKTVVAEMFLAQEIRERGGKGMFLAPLRALAREKINDWTAKDSHFADQKISICTGDYRLTKERSKELSEANIVIMTSEMLNHRSRSISSEQNEFLKDIGTLVIDECLPPNALVETNYGLLEIGKIIDEELDVKVASYNHLTNEVEYKKILARKKKLNKKRWVSIYYKGGNLSVTLDHRVWVEDKGYIAAKELQAGDILYVRNHKTSGTSSAGQFVRGRVNSEVATREIGTVSSAAFGIAEDICRVEIQRTEELGWNPTQGCAKQGVREGVVSIQHSQYASIIGYIQSLLHQQKENCYKILVRQDSRSSCSSSLVYGRRESVKESDDDAYRGIFSIRGRDSCRMAASQVECRSSSVCLSELCSNEFQLSGQGCVSGYNSSGNNSRYVLQIDTQNGTDILFNVRDSVPSRSTQYFFNEEGSALSEFILPSEVGQDVCSHGSLEPTEFWCCDLEVEDNNNFFANGVLVHNCHLLTVPGRGDHLEVGLMKFTEINPKARLVLLSATMPNVEEIADWVSYSLTKRNTFMLRSKYRPVPLTVHYESYYDQGSSYDKIEEEKVNKAMDIIDWYPDDKFLVFAHTKRTGELMKQSLISSGIDAQFHNADLQSDDRANLEDRFRNDPKLRVIVATSTLAWGLNLPARRVIILGAHRGIQEVEAHDILQMIGRSGRLGIDPMGDAYVLVPESTSDSFRHKYSQPNRIESQLLEKFGNKHKILAFHLVSEIHHGGVETTDDVHDWYKRSLAYFQNKSLDQTAVDETLDLLCKCGAIYQEDERWKCRPIGKVASMFYFGPFDSSNLFYNFRDIFNKGKEDDDYSVAMGLSDIDTHKTGIVSKGERQEMEGFMNKVRNLFPGKKYTDSSLKIGFCYYNLLSGTTTTVCGSIQRNLQFDFNRLSQILQTLDSLGGGWDQKEYFKTLEGRITNGVPAHLVNLCRLPNIGKTRANKLYKAGFKTVQSILDMDFEKFKSIVNMKTDAAQKIIDEAKKIL